MLATLHSGRSKAKRDQHGKKSPTDHQPLKDTGPCGIPLPSKTTC
ncbi:hypothetical protein NQ315_003562 [Exocentrus adspersus]|uniref:Uncharacterized protein n=1 Tax=Exocentrus adspersus TaxID=1586481 RepID=A0AAV8VCM3_9CUCU|nr:hypothetical protein NQ315_003562 [Exocentrus adspersus]